MPLMACRRSSMYGIVGLVGVADDLSFFCSMILVFFFFFSVNLEVCSVGREAMVQVNTLDTNVNGNVNVHLQD